MGRHGIFFWPRPGQGRCHPWTKISTWDPSSAEKILRPNGDSNFEHRCAPRLPARPGARRGALLIFQIFEYFLKNMENFDIFQIFLKKVKIWSPRIGQGNFDMRSFSKILSFLDSSLRAASFYAIPSLRGAKSLPAASFPQTLWYLAGAAPPRGGAASPLPRRAEFFFFGVCFLLGGLFFRWVLGCPVWARG